MTADSLTLTFAALADPTRRAILKRLTSGEAVVKDIALPFDMSSPAISKHLRVLERAGLVEQGRQAQWRPRRLRAEPLAEAAEWLQAYRPFWEERFDRIEAVLGQLEAKKRKKAAPPAKRRKRAPSR
ncbi:MAG TPA: metalloregulator ArsR/SmtB family transcription factor [Kofleriaceae bacterium]|nr:metalloregulator ArsR/SmtB family transcription factor [Kofleriaceae bacterium]